MFFHLMITLSIHIYIYICICKTSHIYYTYLIVCKRYSFQYVIENVQKLNRTPTGIGNNLTSRVNMTFIGSFVWVNASFRVQVLENLKAYWWDTDCTNWNELDGLPHGKGNRRIMVDLRTVFAYEFNYRTALII